LAVFPAHGVVVDEADELVVEDVVLELPELVDVADDVELSVKDVEVGETEAEDLDERTLEELPSRVDEEVERTLVERLPEEVTCDSEVEVDFGELDASLDETAAEETETDDDIEGLKVTVWMDVGTTVVLRAFVVVTQLLPFRLQEVCVVYIVVVP
jgi:hypothetical protein